MQILIVMNCTTIIMMLCFGLCFLLSSCDSLHIQGHDELISDHVLSRKLKVVVASSLNIKSNKASDWTRHYKLEDAHVLGKQYHNVADKVHVKGGTWKEWKEGTDDTSEFFTMDYSHVRRRRPIHNKSLRT